MPKHCRQELSHRIVRYLPDEMSLLLGPENRLTFFLVSCGPPGLKQQAAFGQKDSESGAKVMSDSAKRAI